MDSTIIELGAVIILASVLGLLARTLRQPPIIGFIAAGFVLGPLGMTRIENQELIALFSQIGIVLLLFLVGLELDFGHLRKLGKAALNLALLQISLTFALGYSAGLFFGLSPVAAIIVGLALTFSSTIVVLRLISAKNDVQSLYGQLAVALLLIQDLVAVVILVLVTGNQAASSIGLEIAFLGGKLLALVAATWIIAQVCLPYLFRTIAKTRDLLVLSSLAWCFLAAIAAHLSGFSYEVGAFIAGLSLAALPYASDVFGQIRPLRDFFIVLFFVLLGLSFNPGGAVDWRLVWVLIGITVIAKPIIILISLAAQRFRIRTSFFAAFSLGQMSEFSVILAMAAAARNMIGEGVLGAIIIATAISFACSAYIIGAAPLLYSWLKPVLNWLQLPGDRYHLESIPELKEHVIIFGYHRTAFHILRRLRRMKEDVLIVDFNPDIIEALRKQGIPSVFGDASDPELFDTIHLKNAKLVISTIPHQEENRALIKQARAAHKDIAMITTASDVDDAIDLYKAGADYVILPKLVTGEHIADILTSYKTGTLRRFLRGYRSDRSLLRTKEHDLYL